MLTGTVWGITLLIVGFLLSLGAFQLLMTAAAPGFVGQAARNLKRAGFWLHLGMFTIGAVELVIAVNLLKPFGAAGQGGKGAIFLILAAVTFALATGLAAAAFCVGGRLGSPADAARPWRRVIRGAATLGLAWVVPFVGQIVLLPGTAAVGLGAVTLALFQRAGRREAAADLAPTALAA